jgi:SAM-dependent methyltransferase
LLRVSTDPSTDFRETGRKFRDFLVAHCGLGPDDHILDVGCGVGRIAVPLTSLLDPKNGRYDGFDVVPREIAWCQRHISARFPNFHFQVASVRNDVYNPGGTVGASEYTFPYRDGSFDLAVVASVFTHMLARDVERYLMEVSRLLRRGGRCLSSFYLMNDRARENIQAGTSVFDFERSSNGCHVQRIDEPELAVAHDEERVRAMFARYRLSVDTVLYGTWSSHNEQVQDLIIATRIE